MTLNILLNIWIAIASVGMFFLTFDYLVIGGVSTSKYYQRMAAFLLLPLTILILIALSFKVLFIAAGEWNASISKKFASR